MHLQQSYLALARSLPAHTLSDCHCGSHQLHALHCCTLSHPCKARLFSAQTLHQTSVHLPCLLLNDKNTVVALPAGSRNAACTAAEAPKQTPYSLLRQQTDFGNIRSPTIQSCCWVQTGSWLNCQIQLCVCIANANFPNLEHTFCHKMTPSQGAPHAKQKNIHQTH